MLNGFFVTGTDTGVGKTVVSVTLARGLKTDYWKPVQTGAGDSRDSSFAADWLGAGRVHPEAYVFDEPHSPHHANRTGTPITLDSIRTAAPRSEHVIVEGAGGVLVPLNNSDLMIDLIELLRLPTVVVASSRLGTINHSLLTLQALAARAMPVAGVITVGQANAAVAKTIRDFSGTRWLGHVPWCEKIHARLV